MRYAACPDANYDPVAGTCSAVVFVEQPTLLPQMEMADALTVSGLIFTACAIAWGFKFLARTLRQA